MPTITFPGRFKNLAEISDFVAGEARQAGLNESEVYAVQLAVDEACSNIIEHSYGGEGVGEIECTAESTKSGLKIVLRDRGKPFNPEAIPEPNLNVPLNQLKPGGLGVFLMRKMMDEVHFDFNTDGGNVLTMVKRKSHN
jgi:serine/threonine-protein kinase RsbW